MTKEDLEKVLELHQKWLNGKEDGVRADLSGMDLSGFDLWGADLRMANLSGANLSGANLSRGDLCKADMSGANLSGATLCGASLSLANLTDTNLTDATINWTSHYLISELLFRAADSDSRRDAAYFVRTNTELCWKDFIVMDHPEKEWALNVLRQYVRRDDKRVVYVHEYLKTGTN